MQTIAQQDWQTLPELAQQEVYDFFLFMKQRYGENSQQDSSDTFAFSHHTASLIDDWQNEEEDAIWK